MNLFSPPRFGEGPGEGFFSPLNRRTRQVFTAWQNRRADAILFF
jgi:hypothetical protein